MLELLAPAGSMEALRAAVQNGANAVYLGVGVFNARQSAKNFTPQTLVDAIKYCHIRGVQVHLTLNTLVSDREMKEVAETIRHAAENNIDAFIVQDLGVVQLCRQIAPHVPIHGSTQMSIHSLDGVLLCAAMGMKRVVLSRELSREEIRYICAKSPIEIEVFGHGALCMCYSGQCYMSSVIGGRSGNRGRCAQPCRQSYGYGHWQDRYPLSLKDNCLIHYLQELEEMGVASLKLEGRMKRPEYVATVTAVYRKALDEKVVTKPMMEALMTAFNRQGFTDGYYTSRVDNKMFGVREDTRDDPQWLQGGCVCGWQQPYGYRSGRPHLYGRRTPSGTGKKCASDRSGSGPAGGQNRRYPLPLCGSADPCGSRSYHFRRSRQCHAPGCAESADGSSCPPRGASHPQTQARSHVQGRKGSARSDGAGYQ